MKGDVPVKDPAGLEEGVDNVHDVVAGSDHLHLRVKRVGRGHLSIQEHRGLGHGVELEVIPNLKESNAL